MQYVFITREPRSIEIGSNYSTAGTTQNEYQLFVWYKSNTQLLIFIRHKSMSPVHNSC